MDPVAALVDRTLENLRRFDEYSAARKSGSETFEVTQLVNSLLSLLVVPFERGTVEFVGASSGSHVELDGIRRWQGGSVRFNVEVHAGKRPQHLKRLLGGLRNSVAHANFEYVVDEANAISAVTFTSFGRTGTPFWSVTFDVAELRQFLDLLGRELKAARRRQKLEEKKPRPVVESKRRDLEVSLTEDAILRVEELVGGGAVSSVGRYIEEAVDRLLREDQDLAAA